MTELDDLRAAVARVRALHVQTTETRRHTVRPGPPYPAPYTESEHQVCGYCASLDSEWGAMGPEWPCDTIKALDGEGEQA